ncbi:MAG: hypothetical protein J2P34_06685 [Actinobacteria bacterium]|nr:hypothetical protein [Actinomycetota bacterium]
MTWKPGLQKIADLIQAAELQQIVADRRVAQLLLEDAANHLSTAATAMSSGDLSGAYQLAYDALRKSAAGLLEAQGLRATSRGGHIAIEEAVVAQFGTTVLAFRSFGRIRRARNRFEYPTTIAPGPSREDIDDAIAVATQARDAAATILEQDLLTTWQQRLPADQPAGKPPGVERPRSLE